MNLKLFRLLLLSSVLLVLMAGCGGGTSDKPSEVASTPYPTYTPYSTHTPYPTFTSVPPTQESPLGSDSCLLATGGSTTPEDSNLEHVLVKVGASPLLNMWWVSPQEGWFFNHDNHAWVTQLKMTWVIWDVEGNVILESFHTPLNGDVIKPNGKSFYTIALPQNIPNISKAASAEFYWEWAWSCDKTEPPVVTSTSKTTLVDNREFFELTQQEREEWCQMKGWWPYSDCYVAIVYLGVPYQ